MAKPQYFAQKKADEDDLILYDMIAQKHVPETCLLGGVAVLVKVKASEDPCAACEGPRQRCAGRPRGQQLAALKEAVTDGRMDDAAYRKEERKLTHRALDAIVAECRREIIERKK